MNPQGELWTTYSALPHVQKSGLYSVSLPNDYNISFDFYKILIFLMLLYIPCKFCLSEHLCLPTDFWQFYIYYYINMDSQSAVSSSNLRLSYYCNVSFLFANWVGRKAVSKILLSYSRVHQYQAIVCISVDQQCRGCVL